MSSTDKRGIAEECAYLVQQTWSINGGYLCADVLRFAYVCIHVCMFKNIFVGVRMYLCGGCKNRYGRVYVDYMYICTHTHTHMYVCVCVYIYIYIYIYI
jgi:hypothetical protein